MGDAQADSFDRQTIAMAVMKKMKRIGRRRRGKKRRMKWKIKDIEGEKL